MIFVTVGTHEQQFNRLFIELDELKINKRINNEIFGQSGYSTYKTNTFSSAKMVSYYELEERINQSDIIITHGGPGSIMQVVSKGKIPIVVPRQSNFGEHVDDHQVDFTRRLEEENMCIAIYNIGDLENAINNYEDLIKGKVLKKNGSNRKFIEKLEDYTNKIIMGK